MVTRIDNMIVLTYKYNLDRNTCRSVTTAQHKCISSVVSYERSAGSMKFAVLWLICVESFMLYSVKIINKLELNVELLICQWKK